MRGSTIRRRLSYANVMATLAVVIAIAGTGTAVAAVIITSNSQVAKDTISGHAPPTGDHSNIIKGSVNAADLSTAYKSSVIDSCPAGLQLGLGGICFDPQVQGGLDWSDAAEACRATARPGAADRARPADRIEPGRAQPQHAGHVDERGGEIDRRPTRGARGGHGARAERGLGAGARFTARREDAVVERGRAAVPEPY